MYQLLLLKIFNMYLHIENSTSSFRGMFNKKSILLFIFIDFHDIF